MKLRGGTVNVWYHLDSNNFRPTQGIHIMTGGTEMEVVPRLDKASQVKSTFLYVNDLFYLEGDSTTWMEIEANVRKANVKLVQTIT